MQPHLPLHEIEPGGGSVEFDVRAAVESALTPSPVDSAAAAELACFISEDVPTAACGDPGRLRALLVDLLERALRAARRGEVLLRVSLARRTSARMVLRCEASVVGGRAREACEVGLAAASARARPLAPLTGLRALVVDRADTTRKILDVYLTQWDVRARAADSAETALGWLEREVFDVVLLDAQLADTSGLELAERIRADARFTDLPLVVMGARREDEDDPLRARSLPKPLQQAELHGALLWARALDTGARRVA